MTSTASSNKEWMQLRVAAIAKQLEDSNGSVATQLED